MRRTPRALSVLSGWSYTTRAPWRHTSVCAPAWRFKDCLCNLSAVCAVRTLMLCSSSAAFAVREMLCSSSAACAVRELLYSSRVTVQFEHYLCSSRASSLTIFLIPPHAHAHTRSLQSSQNQMIIRLPFELSLKREAGKRGPGGRGVHYKHIYWNMIYSFMVIAQVAFICVIWLIRMCDMTHSYVWHELLMCVTCLIYTWGLNQKNTLAIHQFLHVHFSSLIVFKTTIFWWNKPLFF